MLKDLKLKGFALKLWLTSAALVTASFIMFSGEGYLSLAASLIGVTALIYVAKGHAMGQLLTIVFAVFYGIISYYFRYYGEMITYLGMTAPTALMALIAWLRHPYAGTAEVEVAVLTRSRIVLMCLLAIAATALFGIILKALGNASLVMSTISVTTSFLASYLTVCRSQYYALAYAANDVVLIVLWIQAAIIDISCVPMIVCFVMFLANDLYGFVNWQKMLKRQSAG